MCTILAFALGSFLGGSFGIVMAEDYHNLLTASEDIDRALREYQAKEEQLSAEAEPTMTEEVREALMRLTMCAREECGMCKYKDECGFDFQYKISTDNMNTLADALLRSKCEVDAKSAEAVQIHNDGTLEVKVPNAQKVGRVLVMDTDSHIGGGLFYPDEAVQGEWIQTVAGNGWNEWGVLKCPFCGATIEDKQYRSWEYNFCPNCRAKLEGGGSE